MSESTSTRGLVPPAAADILKAIGEALRAPMLTLSFACQDCEKLNAPPHAPFNGVALCASCAATLRNKQRDT